MTASLRAQGIIQAFIAQMATEAESLRRAKEGLESALAGGQSLGAHRVSLDQANEAYRKAAAQIRKHTVKPKPKASAKAAATPSA